MPLSGMPGTGVILPMSCCAGTSAYSSQVASAWHRSPGCHSGTLLSTTCESVPLRTGAPMAMGGR
jgi:hypothetical protein